MLRTSSFQPVRLASSKYTLQLSLSSPLPSPTLFYGSQEESVVKLKSIKKKQVVLAEHELHKIWLQSLREKKNLLTYVD